MNQPMRRANEIEDVSYDIPESKPARELRTETIILKITPTEKRMFNALCTMRGTTVSTRGAELVAQDISDNEEEIRKFMDAINGI